MKDVKYNKILFFISLLIYFILLIWVVIFKWTNYNSVIISINNFRDLDIFTRYSECYPWFFYYDLNDLLLNIVLFLPLSMFFMLPLKHKWKILYYGLFLSLGFEISQFITCIGLFNIYDLIGNVLGLMIGYLFYLIFKKLYTSKAINVTNIITIILFSPIAIYAIYMTIKNIEIYL